MGTAVGISKAGIRWEAAIPRAVIPKAATSSPAIAAGTLEGMVDRPRLASPVIRPLTMEAFRKWAKRMTVICRSKSGWPIHHYGWATCLKDVITWHFEISHIFRYMSKIS